MPNEYKVHDLYEAAYLVAKGFQINRIERSSSSPRCHFVFKNTSECRNAVSEHWNKQGLINSMAYVEAISYLKDRLYAGV